MIRKLVSASLIIAGIGLFSYGGLLLNENLYNVTSGKQADNTLFIFLLLGAVLAIVGALLFLMASYKKPETAQYNPRTFIPSH